MSEAISSRPLTAEGQDKSRASARGIFCGQSGTEDKFFCEYFSFALSVSFHRCSVFIHLNTVYQWVRRATRLPSRKAMLFQKSGTLETKVLSHCFMRQRVKSCPVFAVSSVHGDAVSRLHTICLLPYEWMLTFTLQLIKRLLHLRLQFIIHTSISLLSYL